MDCRTKETTNFENRCYDNKSVETQRSEERQLIIIRQQDACFASRFTTNRTKTAQAGPNYGLIQSFANHGIWWMVRLGAR